MRDEGGAAGPADEADANDDESAGFGEEREYPADRLRRRIGDRLGNRPTMVYLVLFAGAAALLILLMVVWLSATGGDDDEPLPCFDIALADAQQAILSGTVERVEVFIDRTRPEVGPSVIRLDLKDETCRELPKGADNAQQAYAIVGIVEVYNQTHEERVRISYRRTDVLPEFLVTSTPTPTVTPAPSETASPTATATETPTVPATATPATPEVEETATRTATTPVMATASSLASPEA